jgi:hypothetical protein
MWLANYRTDLGTLSGFYTMNIGNTPDNSFLLQFLPTRLYELYFERFDITNCRTSELVPRKLKLEFGTEETLTSEIELPITPTLEEVRSIKQNSGATTIRTIGERIKWGKLKWQAGVTTV